MPRGGIFAGTPCLRRAVIAVGAGASSLRFDHLAILASLATSFSICLLKLLRACFRFAARLLPLLLLPPRCGAHRARPAGAISRPRAPGAHYLWRRAVAGNGGAMAAAMAPAMVAPPRLATTFLIALWPVKFPGLLRGV